MFNQTKYHQRCRKIEWRFYVEKHSLLLLLWFFFVFENSSPEQFSNGFQIFLPFISAHSARAKYSFSLKIQRNRKSPMDVSIFTVEQHWLPNLLATDCVHLVSFSDDLSNFAYLLGASSPPLTLWPNQYSIHTQILLIYNLFSFCFTFQREQMPFSAKKLNILFWILVLN